VQERAVKPLRAIAKALGGAKRHYLATDPDREGEAISWHVCQVLEQRKALRGVDVKRIVFHEITRNAIEDALRHPRALNRELIDAYLARRALDYLVGFTLSPVLWRKVPGSRSAGRVQSVALRLICEREKEVEAFRPREYWTVDAQFTTPAGGRFSARLTHLGGAKLDKFSLSSEAEAARAVEVIRSRRFRVDSVESARTRRNPQPPFTTSTLQQEAARKLRLGAARTMRLAQQLYEGVDMGGETVGLITYMRTDSVQISRDAIAECREVIQRRYGADYVPEKPRVYKTRAKNAQEAHEAIRPTDVTCLPAKVAPYLDQDQHRLYELIWKRTVASEMASAVIDQVGAEIAAEDNALRLRATGSTVAFDGFLTLYQEDRDDPAEDENGEGRTLPQLAKGDPLAREDVKPAQHFTQPPPRYSEASLVKALEELGIGRPSTYASTIEILLDRTYVRLDKRRFVPEDRGRIVTAFLTSFFERYVQYNFTADLEERLDDVSGGRRDWKEVLREFWGKFNAAVEEAKPLSLTQVIDTLDAELGPHFFPDLEPGKSPRVCPACGTGRLGLKLGRFGAFIGCSGYPECRYTRRLAVAGANGGAGGDEKSERALGADPGTGKPILVRHGPYGPYIQRGQAGGEDKPERVSLPKGVEPAGVTLDLALKLLELPREVGPHPATGQPITAGLGRFGPYVKHQSEYRSLSSLDELLSIGLNRAVALLAEPKRRGAAVMRELGNHPTDGRPVAVMSGRYGPYLKHGRTNAPMPRDEQAESISLETALEALAARKARKGESGRRRRGRKGTPRARGGGRASGRIGGPGQSEGRAPRQCPSAASRIDAFPRKRRFAPFSATAASA
ncbi:MAG: type I DNA topoisomerase, partial [Alphaproteobacteria bacterium]